MTSSSLLALHKAKTSDGATTSTGNWLAVRSSKNEVVLELLPRASSFGWLCSWPGWPSPPSKSSWPLRPFSGAPRSSVYTVSLVDLVHSCDFTSCWLSNLPNLMPDLQTHTLTPLLGSFPWRSHSMPLTEHVQCVSPFPPNMPPAPGSQFHSTVPRTSSQFMHMIDATSAMYLGSQLLSLPISSPPPWPIPSSSPAAVPPSAFLLTSLFFSWH